jgi:hypothetical protein
VQLRRVHRVTAEDFGLWRDVGQDRPGAPDVRRRDRAAPALGTGDRRRRRATTPATGIYD